MSTDTDTDTDTEKADYTADDRGNVVDFYYADSGDQAGSLDREHAFELNASGDVFCSSYYFDGSGALAKWATANGFAKEIAFAFRTGNRRRGASL